MHPPVKVQRMFLKTFQVYDFEGGLMGALPASKASFQRVAQMHQWSPVKPVESELGSWCAKVVAAVA